MLVEGKVTQIQPLRELSQEPLAVGDSAIGRHFDGLGQGQAGLPTIGDLQTRVPDVVEVAPVDSQSWSFSRIRKHRKMLEWRLNPIFFGGGLKSYQ